MVLCVSVWQGRGRGGRARKRQFRLFSDIFRFAVVLQVLVCAYLLPVTFYVQKGCEFTIEELNIFSISIFHLFGSCVWLCTPSFPSPLPSGQRQRKVSLLFRNSAKHRTKHRSSVMSVCLPTCLPLLPVSLSLVSVYTFTAFIPSLSFSTPERKKKLYYYFEACGPSNKALEARVLCLSLVFLLSVSLLPFSAFMPSSLTLRPQKP